MLNGSNVNLMKVRKGDKRDANAGSGVEEADKVVKEFVNGKLLVGGFVEGAGDVHDESDVDTLVSENTFKFTKLTLPAG